jgi:hypothetical protein
MASKAHVLPPDSRMVLIEQLTPEQGWWLDHAVATTFTLDLTSALVAPLAFAAHRVRDDADPLAVMEAVRGCAERVDVFCQAGNITVPANPSALFAFLEPMIHQVRQPKGGKLFHPKIWLARYVNEGNVIAYRLLVLSRNLTADQSWDTCLRLDGRPGSRPLSRNRPLSDLLRWLVDGNCVGQLDTARALRVERLADEVRRVEWDPPADVRAVTFHVYGIGRRPQLDFRGTRHLVVSPFVNSRGLRLVAPVDSRAVHVVSRQEELDRLPSSDTERIRAHVLNTLAGLAGDGADVLFGLHAKLYIVEYDHTARVVIGSANATDAAFGGNVEILVELEGTKRAIGIDTMMGDNAAFAGLLEPHGPPDASPPPADDWRLADLLRRIAGSPVTAQVRPDGSGYRLEVRGEWPLPDLGDMTVTVELVTRRGNAVGQIGLQPLGAQFDGLSVVHVTPFLVLHARDSSGRHASSVVQAILVGDPAGRLDEILARQIDTPDKFLRFLALLLGFAGEFGGQVTDGANGNSGTWNPGVAAGVFELLVRALVEQPKSVADLAGLVERMRRTEAGRMLLPEGFDALWTQIDIARQRLNRDEHDDTL